MSEQDSGRPQIERFSFDLSTGVKIDTDEGFVRYADVASLEAKLDAQTAALKGLAEKCRRYGANWVAKEIDTLRAEAEQETR